MGEEQWRVWSRRGVVQGCPSQVWAARLAQQVQTWVAAVTERREISPPFYRSNSQGSHGQGQPRAIWDRDLFPCGSVWSLLGAGVLEEIPHHSHEQPGLCLPGENGKNRARQRPGTRRDLDKQEGLPSCLETTLRTTSLVTAPLCGDRMRTRAS